MGVEGVIRVPVVSDTRLRYQEVPEVTEEVLTPEEVAAELKMAPKTVKDWLRDGKLPGKKYGRFWRVLRSDLEKFKVSGSPEEEEEPAKE